MATKGELTRQRIVERAAPVFNRQGYRGASMADLVRATGLEKGGIYNHFGSKEALALEAFEYATGIIRAHMAEALAGRRGAVERLQAVTGVFRGLVDTPPLPGGCPIQNTAIEADDTHPALRERALAVMEELRSGTVVRIVARGIERGELRPDTDPQAVASLLIAALEGAVMLSGLARDPVHMQRTADFLDAYVASLATGAEGA